MKKQMIKAFAIVTVASMLFAGCGGTGDVTATSAETETSIVESQTSIQEAITSQETAEVVTETEVSTESHEHCYTGEMTKDPTCDESGVMTYTCSCGDTYTEETGRLDHCTDRSEVTKQATCEEEGIEAFDPKAYTFTQYIKLMYVIGDVGLYGWPDENSEKLIVVSVSVGKYK